MSEKSAAPEEEGPPFVVLGADMAVGRLDLCLTIDAFPRWPSRAVVPEPHAAGKAPVPGKAVARWGEPVDVRGVVHDVLDLVLGCADGTLTTRVRLSRAACRAGATWRSSLPLPPLGHFEQMEGRWEGRAWLKAVRAWLNDALLLSRRTIDRLAIDPRFIQPGPGGGWPTQPERHLPALARSMSDDRQADIVNEAMRQTLRDWCDDTWSARTFTAMLRSKMLVLAKVEVLGPELTDAPATHGSFGAELIQGARERAVGDRERMALRSDVNEDPSVRERNLLADEMRRHLREKPAGVAPAPTVGALIHELRGAWIARGDPFPTEHLLKQWFRSVPETTPSSTASSAEETVAAKASKIQSQALRPPLLEAYRSYVGPMSEEVYMTKMYRRWTWRDLGRHAGMPPEAIKRYAHTNDPFPEWEGWAEFRVRHDELSSLVDWVNETVHAVVERCVTSLPAARGARAREHNASILGCRWSDLTRRERLHVAQSLLRIREMARIPMVLELSEESFSDVGDGEDC